MQHLEVIECLGKASPLCGEILVCSAPGHQMQMILMTMHLKPLHHLPLTKVQICCIYRTSVNTEAFIDEVQITEELTEAPVTL